MERRTFLVAAVVFPSTAIPGCLNSATDSMEPQTSTEDESAFEFEFEEQEGDTSESVRERVILENISGESQYISGYTLEYSSGFHYTFSGGLSLEHRSIVAVVSQGAGDSVAESDPPTYYRNADLPELVLEDGEETVGLLDRQGELVSEATHEAN
jgi:hypothetical protein